MTPRRRLPTVPDPSAPALPAAVTSAVGFLAREVTAHFRMAFERVLMEHRMRPGQYLMLLVLRDEGPMSQQQLGVRLSMDRTTTMQLVQALADAHWIDRTDDPSDKRVYRVSLTAEGRRLTATLEGRMKRAENEILAPLSVDERATFAAMLRRILHATGDLTSTPCDGTPK